MRERLLLAQRNPAQQSPPNDSQSPALRWLQASRVAPESDESGSDRGLFAGGRSARERSESRGQAWGPAAESRRQILEGAGDVVLRFLIDRHARRRGTWAAQRRCPGPKNMSCCFCRVSDDGADAGVVPLLLSNFFNECDHAKRRALSA